jgi:Putative auto-transporter adhesin, head GIN domain
MKKSVILCVVYFLCLACGRTEAQVVVDAHAQVRTLNGDFNKIKVSGSIKVVLSQSDNVALAVSASQDKYIGDIKTVLENNTLRIYSSGESWGGGKSRELTVYLSFKDLTEIQVSGASKVLAPGEMHLEKLRIELSGASEIKADLSIQNLTVQLSGASEARLEGKAKMLDVECSGASDINFYSLQSETCNAVASGASDMEINVTKELNAVASGASHIYYKGEAAANVKNSGVSKISKRN